MLVLALDEELGRQRGWQFRFPFVEKIQQLVVFLGLVFGEVVLFHLIVGEVKEHRRRMRGLAEEFPIALADGRGLAVFPVEPIVWPAIFAIQKWKQIDAVPLRRHVTAGGGEDGGE